MINHQMTVGSMAVCCYILGCEETKKGVVIDPGGNEDQIIAQCSELGLDIEFVIATHGHPDHVHGNAKVQQASGAKIVMHGDDEAFFNSPEAKGYFSMLGLNFSPPADVIVKDGDIIKFGNQELKVLHTPGHSPGGICLLHEKDIFTGDTLFVGAVGRTDFPGCDHDIYMKSIAEKLLVLADDIVVWPGHGYGGSKSTIGTERRTNPFLKGL